MRNQDQQQNPHRHRTVDEGEAQAAKGEGFVHCAVLVRGRIRASPVAKCTSIRLRSWISGTSPSLDTVSVTGAPVGLARLILTEMPSNTSPRTVEATVL